MLRTFSAIACAAAAFAKQHSDILFAQEGVSECWTIEDWGTYCYG